MLKVDPAHRLTSKEVLQQPWLRGEVNATGTTNVLEMMKQYNLEQKQVISLSTLENKTMHIILYSEIQRWNT